MTDIRIPGNPSVSQGKLDDPKKKLERSEISSVRLAVAFTLIGVFLSIGANWFWWFLLEGPSGIRLEYGACIVGMFCLLVGFFFVFWVIRRLKLD